MAKVAEEKLFDEHYRKLEEEFDIEFCSPKEVKDALREYVVIGNPQQHFMVIGEPGGGKSAIVHQVCKEQNLYPIEVRVSTADEGILNGYPVPSPSCPGAVELCMVRQLRDQFEEAKAQGKRVLVFFDELNRGKKNLINSTFNIIDNKLWAGYKMPADTLFVVAVNPASETRNVLDVIKGEDALNRRYLMIGLKPDAPSLLEYAESQGDEFHWLIKEYIRDKPKAIMNLEKMTMGKKYMCPAVLDSIARRFAFLEKKGIDVMNLRKYPSELRLLYAAGGKAEGMAILDYISDKRKHLTPSAILTDYGKIKKFIKNETSLSGDESDTLDHGELTKVAKHLADHIASLKISFSEKKAEGKNLAEFMNDLPEDILKSFIETLRVRLGKDSDTYLDQMSSALCHDENLLNALTKITTAKKRAEKELG